MKRRVIVALSTAGLVSAAAVVYVVAGPSPAASPGSEPGAGQVHTLALETMSSAEQTGGARHPVMGLPAKGTKAFSMLGVYWDDVHAQLDGTVQVRTRSAAAGTWSPWQPVEAVSEAGSDVGMRSDHPLRGATEPLWVGPSNGVQVRVTQKNRALPQGLRVELVDPGDGRRRPAPRAAGSPPGQMTLAGAVSTTDPTSPDPSASPTAPETASPTPTDSASPTQPASPSADPSTSPSPSASPSASASATATSTTSTAPRPAIVSRAQWGADETLVTRPIGYADAVKVVFAHHTVNSNNYSCDQSPAMIRSTMLYHVKTNGWNDIGYNFLVDKCGTIFEGRKGGVDKPLIGNKTAFIDTKAASTAYRQMIWTKNWSTSAKHTIKIVLAGTSGRPTVITDGIAYVK